MKKKNTLFFKKFFLFVLLIIVSDKLLGKVLEYFFLRMKYGEPSRITYVLNKSEDEVLIFGSSKANHHYVPSVFEDNLHLSVYNAGIDGQRIMYHYGVLKSVLSRKSPKIIILDLHQNEFDNSEIGYNGLSVLLPYYRSHKELQDIIDRRGEYEKFKTYSDLYRFNSLVFTIAVNNILTKKDNTINGYYPFYTEWKKNLEMMEVTSKNLEIDSAKVNYFKDFLKEARVNGSKVFVFISPIFRKANGETKSMEIAKRISSENGVFYRDYLQDSLFLQHPEYFHDPSHLNNKGAEIYSKIVCKDIVNWLN